MPRKRGPYFKALIEGFAALGYVDGHTITLHHRFPNETPEFFQRMAADLVALNVDVLVSVGNVASPYARNATETILLSSSSSPTRSGANWWTVSPGRAGTSLA
jgi:putative ABC transport system substrate-binding protein